MTGGLLSVGAAAQHGVELRPGTVVVPVAAAAVGAAGQVAADVDRALILLRRGMKIHGARWYGKVSTFVFYGVMALIVLWPGMPFPLMAALVGLVAVLMLFAFFNYMKVFFNLKKEMPRKPAADKAADSDQK